MIYCAIIVEVHLVLLFERQGKAIDNGPQDLQQLCNPVVAVCLVHKAVEHVVDRLPNVRPAQ